MRATAYAVGIRGEFGAEQLQRHLAAEPQIFSEVDLTHAALAEFLLDAVPIDQNRPDHLHWVLPSVRHLIAFYRRDGSSSGNAPSGLEKNQQTPSAIGAFYSRVP